MGVKITPVGSKHRYHPDSRENRRIFKEWKYSDPKVKEGIEFEAYFGEEPPHEVIITCGVEFTNSKGERVTMLVAEDEVDAYVAAMAHSSSGHFYEDGPEQDQEEGV